MPQAGSREVRESPPCTCLTLFHSSRGRHTLAHSENDKRKEKKKLAQYARGLREQQEDVLLLPCPHCNCLQ